MCFDYIPPLTSLISSLLPFILLFSPSFLPFLFACLIIGAHAFN